MHGTVFIAVIIIIIAVGKGEKHIFFQAKEISFISRVLRKKSQMHV